MSCNVDNFEHLFAIFYLLSRHHRQINKLLLDKIYYNKLTTFIMEQHIVSNSIKVYFICLF